MNKRHITCQRKGKKDRVQWNKRNKITIHTKEVKVFQENV
jgi:hypothetical protein